MQAHIGVLNSKAKGCFKANKNEDALQYYREALCLCQDRNMQQETASLHNNLAHLFLVLKQYKKAYSNADECIRIMKNNAKVVCFRNLTSVVNLKGFLGFPVE